MSYVYLLHHNVRFTHTNNVSKCLQQSHKFK